MSVLGAIALWTVIAASASFGIWSLFDMWRELRQDRIDRCKRACLGR